jgi:signal transduction histidine kinase
MKKFFRQLPLSRKLTLIGVIPLIFLCYIAFQLYREKSDKVNLLQLYTERIYQSENLSKLINALQNERKLSFDLSLDEKLGEGLLTQRNETDTIIRLLKSNKDISLERFEEYTFMDGLKDIRKRIDLKQAGSGEIMNAYTNMIFRLNTLNTSFPATRIFLKPVASQLTAQRLLSEMLTYLGIIRSNIFNILHSREYVVETLVGTQGVYKVYNTYENEFKIKAPADIIADYENTKNRTQLKPTLDYIDSVFKKFSLDSTYTADEWWKVSDNAIDSLRAFQQSIWNVTRTKVNNILQEEVNERNQTLIFLILALSAVIILVTYVLHIISSMMKELNTAATKIAEGNAEVEIKIDSNDAIGSLADSIRKMEKQVRERTNELKRTNTELERSNQELEQFAYVASHDLQEPLRKIRTFADYLQNNNGNQLDDQGSKYLNKIIISSERMKTIISDLLQYSQISYAKEQVRKIDLNEILRNVRADLELMISQKKAIIRSDKLPVMEGIEVQLNQLFYNILNNALKFSKEGISPVINITVKAPSKEQSYNIFKIQSSSKYFQLSITDNGIGFNQEYAEKVFEIFQRLGSEHSGTGIGLALCKKIVENHNGYIKVHSKAGEGTTFDIFLPISQPIR